MGRRSVYSAINWSYLIILQLLYRERLLITTVHVNPASNSLRGGATEMLLYTENAQGDSVLIPAGGLIPEFILSVLWKSLGL